MLRFEQFNIGSKEELDITFKETVTPRNGCSCMTWSPGQPEQMRCDMTLSNTTVTLKALSPIYWHYFRELLSVYTLKYSEIIHV